MRLWASVCWIWKRSAAKARTDMGWQTSMNHDAWGEIINGPGTVDTIARGLLYEKRSVIIGWTDGRTTHHDVMFTLEPFSHGNLQGGLHGIGYLYVSIMRIGAFAFQLVDHPLSPDYVSEKLRVGGETASALAALITAVRSKIINLGAPNATAGDGLQEDHGT